jgi:hypothetical protein
MVIAMKISPSVIAAPETWLVMHPAGRVNDRVVDDPIRHLTAPSRTPASLADLWSAGHSRSVAPKFHRNPSHGGILQLDDPKTI